MALSTIALSLAVQAGDVYVAFVTNGDMGGDSEVRKKESNASLKIFIDITSVVDIKEEAIYCYKNQLLL